MKDILADLGGAAVVFVIIVIYLLLFAMLAGAATPEPKVEMPRWQFGKPQRIEATLFP